MWRVFIHFSHAVAVLVLGIGLSNSDHFIADTHAMPILDFAARSIFLLGVLR